MRLVDLDSIACTGRSLIEKALKDKELNEVIFDCAEWEMVIIPNNGKPYVKVTKKIK